MPLPAEVMSICAYVMFVTRVEQMLQFTFKYMQVYLRICIHMYIQVAHNFDTFYATKLKFGMIFTQTKTLDFMVELPLSRARGQNVYQVIFNTCKMAIES